MNYERLELFVDKLNTVFSRVLPVKRLELSFVEGESVFELALLNISGKVQDRGSDTDFIFYIEDGIITLKKISFEIDYSFQAVKFQSDFELEAKLLGVFYSLVAAYREVTIYEYLSLFSGSDITNPQGWFSILLDINAIPYVEKGLNEFTFENHTVYVSENSVSLVGVEGLNDNFIVSSEEDVIYIIIYVLEYLAKCYDVEYLKLYDDDVETEPTEDLGDSEQGNVTMGEDMNPEEETTEEPTPTNEEPGEGIPQAPNTETKEGLGENTFTQP